MSQDDILKNGGKFFGDLKGPKRWKFMKKGWAHMQNEKFKFPDLYEKYFKGTRVYHFGAGSFGGRGFPKRPFSHRNKGSGGASALFGNVTQTIFEKNGDLFLKVSAK